MEEIICPHCQRADCQLKVRPNPSGIQQFHKLRSHAIENFSGQFKSISDSSRPVPTKGLLATRRYVLGAVLDLPIGHPALLSDRREPSGWRQTLTSSSLSIYDQAAISQQLMPFSDPDISRTGSNKHLPFSDILR